MDIAWLHCYRLWICFSVSHVCVNSDRLSSNGLFGLCLLFVWHLAFLRRSDIYVNRRNKSFFNAQTLKVWSIQLAAICSNLYCEIQVTLLLNCTGIFGKNKYKNTLETLPNFARLYDVPPLPLRISTVTIFNVIQNYLTGICEWNKLYYGGVVAVSHVINYFWCPSMTLFFLPSEIMYSFWTYWSRRRKPV